MIKLKINTRDRDTDDTPRIIEITQFNEIDITMKYDSVASTFRFKFLFDSNNALHAELLAPSHIHEVLIYYVHDTPGRYVDIDEKYTAQGRTFKKIVRDNTTDELLLTGFAMSVVLHKSAKPAFIDIGGYSKPGILQDCDIPTSAYPLQSDGLSFRQIVKKILPYFSTPARGGFNFEIRSSRADTPFDSEQKKSSANAQMKAIIQNLSDDADAPIEKSTAPESKNVLSYLKELAIQKNLNLGHDRCGNLIIDAAYTGEAYLFEIGTEAGIKYTDLTLHYNGTGMHSEIEAVRQPDKNGGNLAYSKAINPLCRIVYRPRVIVVSSGTDITIGKAVESALAAEFKNVSLVVTLASPVVNGKFIMPNNTVRVKDRDVYLYEPTTWFIEEVTFKKDNDSQSCTVAMVLPGTYDGKATKQKDPFLPKGNHPNPKHFTS